MSELTLTELLVLGAVLLLAVIYLWRYIRRSLGLGRQSSQDNACPGCSGGSSCPSGQSVTLTKKK